MARYDSKIKKPFEEYEYTQEEIIELVKCQNDIYEFFKYIKVVHPDQGLVTFVPRDYQEEIISLVQNNRYVIITSSRQSGKSLTLSSLAMHYICFNADKVVGIASNKEKSAIKLLGVIRKMYEELPNWLKPGVKYYARTYIEFDNGSKIIVSATSPDAFRSETINFLLLDEFGVVPAGIASEFFEANYPTISASKESKIVIISTPKGLFNLFHEIYTGAEKGTNDFKCIKISWERVPGRDKKWAEEQIRNIGIVKFNQEFAVQFLGSVNTVIDINTLRQIANEFEYPILRDLNDSLLIYEKPIPGCNYVIGVDVAKGTGNDYSTIQVLKLESVKPVRLTQVASFNNNLIDVYKFSEVLLRTAIYYNKAFVLCENNGEGSAVVNKLWWDYEYSNLVNSGNKRTDLGIRASKKTKPLAVMLLKKLIEDRSLILKDIETLNQLTDFKEKSNGSFACENMHDDLISALYWAVYIFELNILDEEMEFIKQELNEDESPWGILTDIDIETENWEWLTESQVQDKPQNSVW